MTETTFTSWGNVIRKPHESAPLLSRHADFPAAPAQSSLLPYGNGRSYGDSCLNVGAALIPTRGLDRFISLDTSSGVLTCEAGVLLDEMFRVIMPEGWFVPVTPGTRFVTLGGAIANDVHGKNHHAVGTIGRHLLRFELLRSDGQRLICSPTENPQLFSATIGGLGLTGIITWAQLQLRPISGPLMAVETVRFANLDEFLSSAKVLNGTPFIFDVRTDYVKLTNDTVMVPITLQIRTGDITYKTQDGDSTGVVQIIGRVSNITGHIVQSFEDSVQVETPSELLAQTKNGVRVYWKALPLPPGRYKVEIAIKDANNTAHVGTWKRSVDVPRYEDNQLSSSSLILASEMNRVPTKDVGAGNFVIGNTHVVPRVPPTITTPVTFHQGQNLNFWMQVYNLGIGDDKKNNATIEYQVVDLATNKQILDAQETAAKLNPNADQLTLEKTMPLASLTPGRYQVLIKVNDGISKQQIAESAPFNVVQ